MAESLNRQMLPQNICFGCGHMNPRGLHLAIERDPGRPDRLLARFTPEEHTTGFPGIVHGGVLYIALDCMGAWVPTVLRPETKAIWILRSAQTTYHKPTRPGVELTISGELRDEQRRGATVHTEARNPAGDLIVEGDFTVMALPPERFKTVAGIAELPPDWERLLAP